MRIRQLFLSLATALTHTLPSRCSALTEVSIPANIKTIGSAAFFQCASLAKITIANGVEMIGTQAFQDCTALSSIKLPASVISIGNYAFDGGSLYLEGIELPADTTCAAYKYVHEVMKPENKPAEVTPAA